MNCLEFALNVWHRNNTYKIWYNSVHCINLPEDVGGAFPNKEFLPAETFGYDYFYNAFKQVLPKTHFKLLKAYFNKK